MAESAAVGVADEYKSQVVYAYVVPKVGKKVETEEGRAELEHSVKEIVDKKVGPIARPAAVFFVDALPKTRSGKLLRRGIQALAERPSVPLSLRDRNRPDPQLLFSELERQRELTRFVADRQIVVQTPACSKSTSTSGCPPWAVKCLPANKRVDGEKPLFTNRREGKFSETGLPV